MLIFNWNIEVLYTWTLIKIYCTVIVGKMRVLANLLLELIQRFDPLLVVVHDCL